MPTATGDPDLLPGSLEWLRWHWGSAYAIWHYAGEGEPWYARRRDGKRGLRAGDAMALRRLIIDDYGADPVPRELPGQAPPYQVPPQL